MRKILMKLCMNWETHKFMLLIMLLIYVIMYFQINVKDTVFYMINLYL